MRNFRERYDWLRRQLLRKREIPLGEICMAWNCGPDAALKTLKTIKSFDPHIEIRGHGLENRKVVWIEKPYDFEAILEGIEEEVKVNESDS